MNSAYKKFKLPFIPLYLIRWKPNITIVSMVTTVKNVII